MRSKAIYSFVVDDDPKFARQARTFLTTLLATGVPAQAIVAHVASGVDAATIAFIDGLGVFRLPLKRILDGTYCNKIVELAALAAFDAECVVLCDTDLAFLIDPATLYDGTVRAKPVDQANPPLDVLERMRLALGIEHEPKLVRTSSGDGWTYAANCNGGLYVIPGRLVSTIATQWLLQTQAVFAHIDVLGSFAMHADQVGFAMAMLRLGIDVHPLPLECNFPYHLADTFAPSQLQALGVVHYHDRANDDGTLIPTGNSVANDAARAIARALGGARKRRLILHAGASKTGSTSLQRFLTDRRDELRARGVLYPKTGLDEGPVPKHGWLVRCLLRDDDAELDRYLALVESEADDATHTIVLSNEGVFNHWWDFRPAARQFLTTLSERYSISLVLWLREPVAFYRSYYLQALRNPRYEISPGYGADLAPDHALDLPWVAKHLDYAGLVRDMAAVFGEDATFVFAYNDDILEKAATLLDFAWDPSSERANTTTLRESGVEMLRVINRYDVAPPEKERAYAMIAAIDRTIGSQNAPFALSAVTRARIASLCTLTRDELAALDAASTARWFAR